MKLQKKKELLGLLVVVILALTLRFWLARSAVIKVDLATYQLWGLDTIVHGLRGFFSYSSSDYTPGYILVLWFVSKVYWWFMNNGMVFDVDLFYKAVPILMDGVNLILVYFLLKEFNLGKKVFGVLLFLAFWPAWWIVSAQWGQTDGLMMSLFLGSLLMLFKKKWYLSAVMLGFAQAVKPIAILSLPIYFIYLSRTRRWKEIFGFSLLFGLALIASYWPVRGTENILWFVVNRQVVVAKVWPYLTLNSFNLWTLVAGVKDGLIRRIEIGNWLGINQSIWGGVLFGFFLLTSLLRGKTVGKKGLNRWMIRALTITYVAMFMFLTGMHERHLYYGAFFGIMAIATGVPWIWIWVLNITYWLNLSYSIWVIDKSGSAWTNTGVYSVVLLGVVAFLYGWWDMMKDRKYEK